MRSMLVLTLFSLLYLIWTTLFGRSKRTFTRLRLRAQIDINSAVIKAYADDTGLVGSEEGSGTETTSSSLHSV
jgi:hypothetical protein